MTSTPPRGPAVRAVGLGAGGHARVVLDAAAAERAVAFEALVDRESRRVGTLVLGVPIVGDDAALPGLIGGGVTHACVLVGAVRAGNRREALADVAVSAGFLLATVVHPAAVVSPHASIGPGSVILAGAVVGPGAVLGTNVIVNHNAVVEHDARVGAHSHIGPGAILLADVTVGTGSLVGAGAVCRQGVAIGDRCLVAAGAVLVRDAPQDSVFVGVPARSRR